MCRCHPCRRESPTLCLAGMPSSFALVVWVFVCRAATQCCSCCSCWSSPGFFQDHCSATMWKSRQLMLTLRCSCCCTRLLYCWHTKVGSRPCWSKMLHIRTLAQLMLWEGVDSLTQYIYICIYLYYIMFIIYTSNFCFYIFILYYVNIYIIYFSHHIISNRRDQSEFPATIP